MVLDLITTIVQWGLWIVISGLLLLVRTVTTAGFLMLVIVCFATIWNHVKTMFNRNTTGSRTSNIKTLVILGSGGHTREILNLVKALSPDSFFPRVYVSTLTDPLSLNKARGLESAYPVNLRSRDDQFLSMMRIREVGESFFWVLFYRAPLCLVMSAILVFRQKPDLILCNGPGVCVPICLMSYLFNMVRITSTKIVFIESICRVKTLSLTGKIMMYLSNEILVQWEDLETVCREKYPNRNVKYLGRLA